jgi:hypothetical protein
MMKKLTWKEWLVIFIAPLPYLFIYLNHFWIAYSTNLFATGFIAYDMPYYLANAREIFESGNCFAYSNPYAPDTGVIYFHWLIWLFGVGVVFLGLDPGWLFMSVGVSGSFVFSALTYFLLKLVLAEKRSFNLIFLLSMWAGGLFVIAKMLNNLAWNENLMKDLLAFDQSAGYWFFYWGRNTLFPTEVIYHILFLVAWIGLVKNNFKLTAIVVALLASTHPFSGLQLILILLAYLAYLMLVWKEKIPFWFLASVAATVLLFSSYYGIYLNKFESHRNLQNVWTLDWKMLDSTAFAAHLVVFIFVLLRFRKSRGFTRTDGLFVVSALVSMGLAKHDLFIEPHQPLHFTRGYTWFPLFVLAAPFIQNKLIWIKEKFHFLISSILILTIFLVASLDNTVFILKTVFDKNHDFSVYLTRDEHEMMSWIDAHQLEGVVLWPDLAKSYLLATYTSTTPYYGHIFMTPDIDQRHKNISAWWRAGKTDDWFDAIDYVIIDMPEQNRLDLKEWILLYSAGDLLLFVRAE